MARAWADDGDRVAPDQARRFGLFRGAPVGAVARRNVPSSEAMSDAAEPERVTVVYVEDDERLARLTAQYLGSHGVEVFVVPSGDDAVAEVLRVRPDVVLLDVMLPGLSGLEVCKRLRERVDVPIVMVTARTEEADRVSGLENGFAT
jgi:CheY-like chemotaxis protein